MVHFANNHNAFLSEGGALAVLVGDFPEKAQRTRNDKHFPRPLRQNEARLRMACPCGKAEMKTWCVQPIPWTSLLQGLQILPRPLGQVTRPVLYQDTLALKQIRARIGRLDPVPDHMRQSRLDHLSRMIGLLTCPVPEAGAEPVQHGGNPKLAQQAPQLAVIEWLPRPFR